MFTDSSNNDELTAVRSDVLKIEIWIQGSR